MAARARVEFVNLDANGNITHVGSTAFTEAIADTSTPTLNDGETDSRIIVPGGNRGITGDYAVSNYGGLSPNQATQLGHYSTPTHARIRAVSGNLIVSHGEDPTAGQDSGLALMAGEVALLQISPGHKLSFIELDIGS